MLSNWRTIGATVAQIVIAVILPMVVYTTDAEGHKVLGGTQTMIASAVCSVLAVVVYMICYHLTTERVKMQSAEGQKNVFELFKVLFTDRAFVGIVISALIFLLVQMTLSGMNNYIYPNYFNSAAAISVSSLLACVVVLVLSTFVTKLSDKIGKKELSAAGAFIGAAALFVGYIVHTKSVVVFICIYLFAYIGLAFFNLMCWAMIIDVIDDIEVKKGIRSDGTVYSVYSFARKLGQAAANGLTGLLLTIVGYSSATAFDEDVVNGIYNVTTLFPAIGFVLLACSLLFLYPLSKKKVLSNVAELTARKAK